MSKTNAKSKRNIILLAADIFVFTLSYIALAFLSQVSSSAVSGDKNLYILNYLTAVLSILFFRLLFGVYRIIWRYASYSSYMRLLLSDACGGELLLVITYFTKWYLGLWQTATIIFVPLITSAAMRLVYQYLRQRRIQSGQGDAAPVAIIGAGNAGNALVKELSEKKTLKYKPRFFVDVDIDKVGRRINGLMVLDGNADTLYGELKKNDIRKVIIAIDKSKAEIIKRNFDSYSTAGFEVLLFDFDLDKASGDNDISPAAIRNIKPEDLLFREQVKVPKENFDFYCEKTVLVTGGGGSIGSEISRQIASHSPKRLIIFDIYENNAYDIQQELIRKYGDSLDLCVEIGSVRDVKRLEEIFEKYKPDVVFHAAAHKHVPLMEHSAEETVKNNVLGTKNTADMAEKYGCEKFVLISTDKAVNPTNVMGASKRMCEMVVLSRTDSKTSFTAVRFGNVLGSNGSVIPLFKKQIEEGGPVTITDKRIIRYFMTINEASMLVLLAGVYAKNGELFVLDMGKPVKILELAESMIRLAGLEPYKDIVIVETGLRPGEKLFEELLMSSGDLQKTEHSLLFIERAEPLERSEVDAKIAILEDAIRQNGIDSASVREAYKKVVPTFVDADEINSKQINKTDISDKAALVS